MNDTRNELSKLPMPSILKYITNHGENISNPSKHVLRCQPPSTHWDHCIWLVNQPVFYSSCKTLPFNESCKNYGN
ncbi:hypothetical protein ACJIZ3_019125 [Penstemon smallii]|uniref:Uncharacterized protein n=1 Tax=Penstemon smallii TaxID=265156 RepID=A0ABD3T1J3_9LAMI